MSNKAKQKSAAMHELKELEVKKRNGIIKIVIALVVFVVFVIVRLALNVSNTIPLDNMWFNLFTLIFAFLACYFAGTGSNDIAKANRRRKEIEAGQYRPKKGPSEKW